MNKVIRRFDKQLAWILDGLDELSFFKAAPANNAIEDEIEYFLNQMPESEALAEDIVASMKPAMSKGGRQVVKDLDLGKLGISFSLANVDAQKFLGGKLSHELSNYRGNIQSTTKEKIAKILLQAAINGQSYRKTAEQIMDQGEHGVFTKSRAQMIATREIGVAYEKGNQIPVSTFKSKYPDEVVQKFWQTVEDEKVTKPHEENQNAGWIDYEQTFPGTNDKIAPGSDNPRCRCFTKYRIL